MGQQAEKRCEEIVKWNQRTALGFQTGTGGGHQTSPASLRGWGWGVVVVVVIVVAAAVVTAAAAAVVSVKRAFFGK